MSVEFGVLLFVIGIFCTIIGFLIAFKIATYKTKKVEGEENALTNYHRDNIYKYYPKNNK